MQLNASTKILSIFDKGETTPARNSETDWKYPAATTFLSPTSKSMSSSNFNRVPLRDCVRDKEYFLEDGDCVVLVEDTLFKVCFMLRLE